MIAVPLVVLDAMPYALLGFAMHMHSSNSRRTRPMILSCLLALSAALPSTTLAQPQKATARAFPPDSVVLAIIKQRVEEHRKQAAANPNRPGPKPKGKVKPSASGRAKPSSN